MITFAGLRGADLPGDHDQAAKVHRLHVSFGHPFRPHRVQRPGERKRITVSYHCTSFVPLTCTCAIAL